MVVWLAETVCIACDSAASVSVSMLAVASSNTKTDGLTATARANAIS